MSSGALSFFLVIFCQVYSAPFFFLILRLFLRFLLSTLSAAHKTHPHFQSEICSFGPVLFFDPDMIIFSCLWDCMYFVTAFCALLPITVIVHLDIWVMLEKLGHFLQRFWVKALKTVCPIYHNLFVMVCLWHLVHAVYTRLGIITFCFVECRLGSLWTN